MRKNKKLSKKSVFDQFIDIAISINEKPPQKTILDQFIEIAILKNEIDQTLIHLKYYYVNIIFQDKDIKNFQLRDFYLLKRFLIQIMNHHNIPYTTIK